jgi:Glu-tRNA(Gln) amidotransferase subunit E-like FAD-binding protein
MTEEIDYEKVGLKAGLEIHQQLDTGKLFSRTPSLLRSDKPDYIVKRKLHKVAGEEGKVDEAVQYESEKDKEFYYEGYEDTIGLVELDEEPCQGVNEEALDIALQIALLLDCEIYQHSQVMRKTVIDGSNTSGFQRTFLIGHSGKVECTFGRIGIESVALEEDSARIISREEDKRVYRLDRLGIPLVEITTRPELNTPEKIKECALKIGEILRACKVRRGIGTIRQDLNISIKGHDRVEIKGFQDPKVMIKTVNLEIERQKKDKKKNGEVRNVLPNGKTEFLRPIPGRARMYPETDLELVYIPKKRIDALKKNLPKLKTEIKQRLKKSGLSEDVLKLVLDKNKVDEFDTLMRVYSKNADLIGKAITLWKVDLAAKESMDLDEVEEKLSEKILEKIFEALKSGKIEESDVRNVMSDILQGKDLEEAFKIEKVSNDLIEEKIRKIVLEKPGLRENAYMGLVMSDSDLRGRIDAKKAMEIIIKVISEN